jgi:hypothetical protein
MRVLGAWGVTLALLLGVGPAFAGSDDGATAGDNGSSTSGGNWFTRWFYPAAKPPEKPAVPTDVEKIKKEKDDPKEAKPLPSAADQRLQEQAKYFRRLSVCDRLKEIADATNDAALWKRANELDGRAWDVYTQSTAHLPAAQVFFKSDKKTLEKHLGQLPGVPEPVADAGMYTVPGEKTGNLAKEDRR